MTTFKLAKGVKDWYGSTAILRNTVRDTLRNVFEKYGYNPIETPMIERVDSLGFKGGGEIQKEVFRVIDQGKRELALRFDQTVPLARFYATNSGITLPFKRYVIGEVFRDGPTQPEQGRYRIFTQCDVDVLGVKGMAAEAELLALAKDAFAALGLGGVEVKINNRKLLEGVLNYAGVAEYAKLRTITVLDKMDKIGLEGVEQALLNLKILDHPKKLSDSALSMIYSVYIQGGNVERAKVAVLPEFGVEGWNKLNSELEQCDVSTDEGRIVLIDLLSTFSYEGNTLLTTDNVTKLLNTIQRKDNNQDTWSSLASTITDEVGKEGLKEVKELLSYADEMGLDFVQFDPSLARGLDYYTGTTIEVFLKDKSILNSAILAGGRFDDMVGDFCGGNSEIPAVGFSFGLERLVMILEAQKKFPQTMTDIYLVPIDIESGYMNVAQKIRDQGINVDVEMNGRKVGQAISYANGKGIPYVGLVGSSEMQESMLTLKCLGTREQTSVKIEDISKYLRK